MTVTPNAKAKSTASSIKNGAVAVLVVMACLVVLLLAAAIFGAIGFFVALLLIVAAVSLEQRQKQQAALDGILAELRQQALETPEASNVNWHVDVPADSRAVPSKRRPIWGWLIVATVALVAFVKLAPPAPATAKPVAVPPATVYPSETVRPEALSFDELQKGDIMSIQRYLNTHSYPVGTPDGIVGPKTRAAIIRWYTNEGFLEEDNYPAHLLARTVEAEASDETRQILTKLAKDALGITFEEAVLNFVRNFRNARKAAQAGR